MVFHGRDTRAKEQLGEKTDQCGEGSTRNQSRRPTDEQNDASASSTEAPFTREIMALVSRVARYQACYFDGLLRYNGDEENALEFAHHQADGMSESEFSDALRTIDCYPGARDLLDTLSDAANRDVLVRYEAEDALD